MNGLVLLGGITAGLIALGWAEAVVHRRNLEKLPLRIHVNGTRGKSSVTRLIAAGLREGGLVTCAKTTGTLPRMILPNGKEYPVYRPSGANIIEQIRIVRTAASYTAEALVIECMAVIPFLQWLCESKLVRATHAVITNAREDHLDVMGPTEEDVALSLAGMVPLAGKLYTAEQRHLDALQKVAEERGTTLIPIGPPDIEAVTAEELAKFSYVEHAENVALALRVCEDIGVDRQTALRGMIKAQPDPGAMTTQELDYFGRRIFFVNGFAANDPESTARVWHIALARYPNVARRIAVFNCRGDRTDRSQQLGAACVRWKPADHYILIGSGTYLFARAADAAGLDMQKVTFAEDRRVEEIFELILEHSGPSALVMGMGNIGGPGLDILRHFQNRSIVKAPAH